MRLFRAEISRAALTARGVGLAAAVGLAVSIGIAPSVSAQTVTLRFHTHVPPVARSFKNLQWLMQKMEKESGGKLKIQMFGSMQLGGKAPDIYDQVKNGVVDMGFTLPGYKAGLFPLVTVFELPFIGEKADAVSPAIDEFIRKWGKKEFGDVYLIAGHSGGESVIHTKPRPVKTLADFKGLKLRTPSRTGIRPSSARKRSSCPWM